MALRAALGQARARGAAARLMRGDLPIQAVLPEVLATLARHPRLVLEAPPGAGKTTQVPLALLDAPWLQGRRIVMLEPRRVATRAAATFMARQLGEAVGGTVGYRIRFERKVSERTRIEVVTEGLLTRMLQDDPLLEGVGALLFDEFHERHLPGDLGLALALDVQASVRPDLRIVLMSATLEGAGLAQWLDAPRIASAGRSFPVTIAHRPPPREGALAPHVHAVLDEVLRTHPGDVLVFLPGRREMAQVQRLLQARPVAAEVLNLHGDLPVAEQTRVLQPDLHARRVVLATNVAESSVTLPGVRVVIDSGLAREPRLDSHSGFSRLDVVTIAQASADQRAGRAGRVAEGWAYRLWPQAQRLAAQRRPEIAQVDLAGLALELAAWGSQALRFPDPPPPGALAAGRDLLQRLGALDAAGTITAAGRRMLQTGAHPRLAAMMQDDAASSRTLACDLAALLEARDPLPGGGDALADRWHALQAWRSGRPDGQARTAALAALDAASRQWRRRLRVPDPPDSAADAHTLGRLLARAFPDRIARRHPDDPLRYTLANGRRARLSPHSGLVGHPWLVASEVRSDTGDGLILRAAPVHEDDLRSDAPAHWREGVQIRWDTDRRALVSERVERFDGIVLGVRPSGERIDPALAAEALTDAVRTLGLHVLPWSAATAQLRVRMQCLRAWMPELALPDLGDAALLASLATWLQPALAGHTRLDTLTADALTQALLADIDWPLRQRVDRLAPQSVTVPSGQARRIEYRLDDAGQPAAPVLAVKLQELFGLADTPRVADGRIPVLIHLLSPAGRPLQVTTDLRSFWNGAYAEVRKDMKGRYPKHPWPDDPWNAQATHRAKPRPP